MTTKNTAEKSAHSKKEFKKELTGKMESALPEMKKKLGEKKFERRIKKAAKILVHGLHSKDFSATNETATKTAEPLPKKIKSPKKSKATKEEVPSK